MGGGKVDVVVVVEVDVDAVVASDVVLDCLLILYVQRNCPSIACGVCGALPIVTDFVIDDALDVDVVVVDFVDVVVDFVDERWGWGRVKASGVLRVEVTENGCVEVL